MDESNRRTLDKLIPIHHSLEDWDYQADRGLGIATDQYISSPSSLKEQAVDFPGAENVWVYLKAAVRQKIESGRFITYHRAHHDLYERLFVFFWSQAVPINSDTLDCYRIHFFRQDIKLEKVVDGISTTLETVARDYEWNIDTWYRYRVTWFTFIQADLTTALRVIVDIEQASAWVEKMTFDISDPLWLASDTKLTGFFIYGSDTSPSHIDDTEIWEKVE